MDNIIESSDAFHVKKGERRRNNISGAKQMMQKTVWREHTSWREKKYVAFTIGTDGHLPWLQLPFGYTIVGIVCVPYI